MISHPSQELVQILSFWGYSIMFVLMVLEGPIVTIIGAFMSSMGYFNVFAVFALSVTGDVVGDIILYSIGYWGGRRILGKAERLLRIKTDVIEKLKIKFHANSERIIFYVKSTTGLSYVTFILAGTLKMNIFKFVKNSIYGGLVWSLLLVIVGYFFGYAAERISDYIKYAGVIILLGAVAFFVGLALYKKKQAKDILE